MMEWGRFVHLLLLAASLVGFAQTPASAKAPSEATGEQPSAFIADVNTALTTARNGDCETGMFALTRVRDSDGFASLQPESQVAVQEALLGCFLQNRQWLEAYDLTNRLIERHGDSGYRLWVKIKLANFVGGVIVDPADIERLGKIAPARLNSIGLHEIWDFYRDFSDDEGGDQRLAFLRALWGAQYKPSDPGQSRDDLAREYARLLRERGLSAQAARIIGEINEPQSLAETLFDKRYDGMRQFKVMPSLDNFQDYLDRNIDLSRQTSDTFPNSLGAQLGYVRALHVAGKFTQAEAAAAAASALISDHAKKDLYADYDEKAPWLLNEWAYLLYDIGRFDDARAVLRRAANLDESGAGNVSQRINLAIMLFEEGRFDEAVAAVNGVDEDNASLYGELFGAAVRVCAAAFGATISDLDEELSFLSANRDESPTPYARAQLCQNNKDVVAANWIERLADPEKRNVVLRAAQNTLAPPVERPIARILRERRATILARPDMQAAINEFGRVLALPLYPIDWSEE